MENYLKYSKAEYNPNTLDLKNAWIWTPYL